MKLSKKQLQVYQEAVPTCELNTCMSHIGIIHHTTAEVSERFTSSYWVEPVKDVHDNIVFGVFCTGATVPFLGSAYEELEIAVVICNGLAKERLDGRLLRNDCY